MRHRGYAEVIADHELDTRGLGLGEHLARVLQPPLHLVHSSPWAASSAALLLDDLPGKIQTGRDESAPFDQELNAFVIHQVRVVDHVHPGRQPSQDALLGGDVPANLFAPLMRGLGGGLDFIGAHGHHFARPGKPMPAGGVELDDVDALLDLFAHRPAEIIGPIADTGQTVHLELPEIGVAIDRVTGGDEVPATGQEAWTGDQASSDGSFEGDVDIVHSARAHRAGTDAHASEKSAAGDGVLWFHVFR